MAALKAAPSSDPEEIALLVLYLQLWVMDIAAAERFSADPPRFDVADPPADFWYPRVDTAGTHAFFENGLYLTNAIPPASKANYYNAEIYGSTQTKQQPRNILANLFPVDNPKDLPNLLADLFLNNPFTPAGGLEMTARIRIETLKGGSRGWGFWNTSVLPPTMQVAWFIHFNGKETGGVPPFYDDGFYAITQNGLSGYAMTKLPDLDEDWHDYRIWIGGGQCHYFIDGDLVATVDKADAIPVAPMTFHNWVDNALFGLDKTTGEIVHIMQQTDAPRVNLTEHMRIRSLP